jgi:hypothetical protein
MRSRSKLALTVGLAVATAAAAPAGTAHLPSETDFLVRTTGDFVRRARQRPDLLGTLPVEGLFRYLAERYPCPD